MCNSLHLSIITVPPTTDPTILALYDMVHELKAQLAIEGVPHTPLQYIHLQLLTSMHYYGDELSSKS